MNNVLLTGASGNIGSFLSKDLEKKYNLTYLANKNKINGERIISIDLNKKSDILQFIRNIKNLISIFLVGLAHKKG